MSETNQLQVLGELHQYLGAGEEADLILRLALNHVVETLGCRAAQIYCLSTLGNEVWLYLEMGPSTKPVTPTGDAFALTETNIISDALNKATPVYIPDVHESPYSYYAAHATDLELASELAIPLQAGQNILGVLRLESWHRHAFDAPTQTFYTTLALLLATLLKAKVGKSGTAPTVAHTPNIAVPAYQYDKQSEVVIPVDTLPELAESAFGDEQVGVTAYRTNDNQKLLAPIRLHGETIGMLGIENLAEAGLWTPDDISLLEEVSSQVALAIENSQLIDQTQQRTDELALLFETSRRLSETINLNDIYGILADQIINYLKADVCYVYTLHPAQTHVEPVVIKQTGPTQTNPADPVSLEDDSVFQRIVQHPRVVVEHTTTDPINTLAYFPLVVRNNLVGVLQIRHLGQQRTYTQNETQLVQAMVSQVTVAIENAQLFEQTQGALSETQKLYEISQALVEASSLDSVYQVITENIKTYDIDRVTLTLLEHDDTSDGSQIVIVANWDRDAATNIMPIGSIYTAQDYPVVTRLSQPPFDPIISEDLSDPTSQDERLDESFRKFIHEQLGLVTLFAAPMLLGSDYKGVLFISTRAPHPYSRQEIRIYQTLADQAIVAIERYRLLEATLRERDRTAFLFEFGQRLNQVTSIQSVEAMVLDFASQAGAAYSEIYLTDGEEYVSMASSVPVRRALSVDAADYQAKIALTRGYEGQTLQSKAPRQRHFTADGQLIADAPSIKAQLCVPFKSQLSELRGVLSFLNTTDTPFPPEQVALFEALTKQTADTLENVWLLQQTGDALSETELLYRAARDFSRAQRLEDLLATLVERLIMTGSRELHIDHMSVALITDFAEKNKPAAITIAADWDKNSDADDDTVKVNNPNVVVTAEEYPFIARLNADAPQMFNRAQQSKMGVEDYLQTYLNNARIALCVPLTVSWNWLGVLFVSSRTEGHAFTSKLVNQISTLVGQVAVIIQNLELVKETQQNLYNSEILSHLSQELLGAETRETIYALSLDAIAATEPNRGAAVFMYNNIDGQVELTLESVWDNPRDDWPQVEPGTRFSAEDLGLTALLHTGDTVISTDAIHDDAFTETLQQMMVLMQIGSMVSVPLWLNKAVSGFILVSHAEPGEFSADIIRLYENIGRQTSSALENLRLLEEAKHRATQLATASEVSEAAASYLDLTMLMSQTVSLIRDRFGFYHVSIYLLDEYNQHATIAASTGEVGRRMLAVQHKLRVGGQSVVGAVTATGRPKVVSDVTNEATYFHNPLLLETRSEMALPLLTRGHVIGALSVQNTERGSFAESDITILQSMANQLANAIEAARAFQESQDALQEISKLNEANLRKEWSTFLVDHQTMAGYRLTNEGIVPATTDNPDEYRFALDKALDKRQALILPLNGHSEQDVTLDDLKGQEVARVIAPVNLHGQAVIGAVDFEVSTDEIEIWAEDTLHIIEAVAAQAAQAIEAARLFEQTQAAREEAEALYIVGRTLVATDSDQEMFHVVLREMLSTLNLKQGGILLLEPDRKNGELFALFENGEPVQPNLRIPIEGNASYDYLIKHKRPLAIEDTHSDPLFESVRELNVQRGVASMLLVPIIIDDEVIGAIGADSIGQPHNFTEREINLASAMADQLAIMMQNRQLLTETRRRAIQLQTSFDVSRVATSILDQDIMMSEAVELIRDRFGYYHAQIFIIDELGQFAVLRQATGIIGAQLLEQGHRIRIGAPNIIGQVTFLRRSMVARDSDVADSDIPFEQSDALANARSELATPLQVGNRLIGALDLQSISPDDFTKEDITTLESLAGQLAIALQNAYAFREQQETADRLKEIDKLKTQFLANMSHELRTPLNSIIGFSRVILKGIDGPLTDLQKQDLTSIHNSGQHLLGLINNILDLSKIEAGKMELNQEETDIQPIIKQVASTALALVKDKTVQIIQDVPDEMPSIWADPTRIRQVVLNLVSNAAKFTEEGTITVSARADQAKIVVSVADTGIGIPDDQLDSIFEEFTQVDASTTRKVGGTGLGLPICRHFIEMHKGQIWVESMVGKGSTFSFAIPINNDDSSGEDGLNGDAEEADGGGKVIVAIDDDSGVINLYKRFLEKRNYKIVGVKSTDAVTDRVKAFAPAVILLDILMPGRDGWAVIRELKEDPYTADIPVIICSIVSDKNRGYSMGAADYLIKPIVEGELIAALRNLNDTSSDQVKVLVIDDQADDILLTRRILEAQNYKIIEAKDGKEGLDLARSRQPHLIILDLNMPGMDGFSVLEVLKKEDKTKSIPIIIVSAKEVTPSEQDLLSEHVEVLLRKGIFTENELLDDVSKALQRSQPKEMV